MDDYSDIIHLPHHTSQTRPRMPLSDRAAQFAPFAALTGHEDAIKETGRITDTERELQEDVLEELNKKLQYLVLHPGIEVSISYFEPDDRKAGGQYRTYRGCVKQIDSTKGMLVLTDKTQIPVSHIVEIEW